MVSRSSGSPYKKPVPKTDEQFVSYIKKKFDQSKTQRYMLEKNWFMQVAYYRGLHYYSWNERDRQLREPATPSWRVKLVVNYALSTVETALAKLLKNKPILNVVPATSDDKDVSTAKMADRILEVLWEQTGTPEKDHELGKWMLVCGTAFSHIYWDGKAGIPFTEQVPGPDGQMTQETFYPGAMSAEVVPPFEIYEMPGATGMHNCWILGRQKARHIEDVRQQWPDVADQIQPDSDIHSSTQFDIKLLTLGLGGSQSYSPQKNLEDMVMVRELWERPEALSDEEREEFPKGRLLTCCGNVLLHPPMANPYDHGEIPYVKYDAITIPGQFWGMGYPELMMSLNRAYNRGRSRILEGLALMGSPKWLMTSSSAAGREAIDSEPGEVVSYNQGEDAPQMVSPPAIIAPGHMESMTRDVADINEVTGLREVSRGGAPTGVSSGVAINLLQEQDDTRFGLVAARWEKGKERTGRLMLYTARQFMIEPRLMKLAGDDGTIDAVDFMGADLGNNVDVKVVLGSAMPQSKIARQALFLDLWDKGVIPREDPKIMWSLMDMEYLTELLKKELADERCADWENREMQRGMPMEVLDFQDQGIHLTRHNIVRKGPRYAQMDPMIRAIFDWHCQQHEQKQQMQQMVQQYGMNGMQQPGVQSGLPPTQGIPNASPLPPGI